MRTMMIALMMISGGLTRIFHEYFIPMTDLVDSALLYLKKSLYVPSGT